MLSLLCAAVVLGSPIAREVSFTGFEGLTLKGTLLLPSGGKPVSAVLLLPGSGPTDRDGNVPQLGFQPSVLKQIAEALADKGIGSLRFDKRATAGYKSQWPTNVESLDHYFRYEAFLGDARAALDFLRTQPEVSALHTGIVGHSEGALLALSLAKELAGTPGRLPAIGLLCGAGRPIDAVIMEQLRTKLPQQLPKEMVPPYLEYAQRALDAARANLPYPPNPPAGLGPLFAPTSHSLMHRYVTLDPAQLAGAYDGNAIVIEGEYDNQVSVERDAKLLYRTLMARKRGVAELVIAPRASHNLKAAKTFDENAFSGPIVAPILPKLTSFLSARL